MISNILDIIYSMNNNKNFGRNYTIKYNEDIPLNK